MALFKTNDNSSLLIRIGYQCPSNCQNCIKNFGDEYICFDKFNNIFPEIDKHFDKNFEIYFFGCNSIFHPDISGFIDKFIELGFTKISLQIPPFINDIEIKQVYVLQNKYRYINFDSVGYIENPKQFKLLIKSINLLSQLNINSSLDIFIDFSIYYELIKKISNNINTSPGSHIGHTNAIEIKIGKVNISFYNQKKHYINKGKIINFNEENCIFLNSFEINDNLILIKEEIEIDNLGNINFHFNPYCSLSLYGISNILLNENEILTDFRRNISLFANTDCNDCIKKYL